MWHNDALNEMLKLGAMTTTTPRARIVGGQ